MSSFAASVQAAARQLPSGRSLPAASWERRHRGILVLLALHAFGLGVFGFFVGLRPWHALVEGAVPLLFGLAAAPARLAPRVRGTLAAAGLMSSSAILVHLSGGYIEAHFHFFVMLGVIFLYEDWVPYVVAIAYVALHHGIAGTIDPASVFNHPSGFANPWLWAGIHALFIFGLSAALVVTWSVVERARRAELAATSEAAGLKRQLAAQEKLAALGSLAAGLAHEIRTPLTVVALNAALIERRAQRASAGEGASGVDSPVKEIQASVARMNALVQQLRRFHRLAPEDRVEVAMDDVVRDATAFFSIANAAGPRIETDLRPVRPALIHPLGVQQIVLNLLSNAAHAVDRERARIVARTFEEGGWGVIVVEDNGAGIDPVVQARMFEPLVTTRQDGMGLGLAIVKRIVDEHGGEVTCRTARGEGTAFTVRIPLAERAPVKDAPAPEPRAATAARAQAT